MSAFPIASVSRSFAGVRLARLARYTPGLIVGALGLLCGSCGGIPAADQPQSYLDQSTAATIMMAGRPLVFARERPNFAVHMRDYITLAAASIDRGGKIQLVLIAYFWTTFDPHARDDVRHPDELTLLADDRRITLTKLDRTAHDAGIEERVNAPAVGSGPPVLYSVDVATLRFIAAARSLSAHTRTGDTELDYSVWDDRRGALSRWLHEVGGN
jgi:hypothetical protein